FTLEGFEEIISLEEQKIEMETGKSKAKEARYRSGTKQTSYQYALCCFTFVNY
ncbi:13893_t:CDS:1, partial [Funneliformis mosseae]